MKNKKNIISLSTAEFGYSIVSDNKLLWWGFYLTNSPFNPYPAEYLISHTHFWLSTNQITSYNVFEQIHKLNDTQCRSWSEAIWAQLFKASLA